jgi:hypothetical protein
LIVDTGGAYREELPEQSAPSTTTAKPGRVTDIFADLA